MIGKPRTGSILAGAAFATPLPKTPCSEQTAEANATASERARPASHGLHACTAKSAVGYNAQVLQPLRGDGRRQGVYVRFSISLADVIFARAQLVERDQLDLDRLDRFGLL